MSRRMPRCKPSRRQPTCVMCAGAIGWAQIGRIVYGASDEKRGYQLYAPRAFHPKATVTRGVLEAECRQLMQEFFKQKR